MKYFLIFLTLVICSIEVTAQAAEDSVKAVIERMFLGMQNADTNLLKSTFADGAIFQTVSRTKEGNTIVRTELIQGFIDFVGKQPKGATDERITFASVNIDGSLASVWTPYSFYAGGKFIHCGANSFQLVRLGGDWKIQYLIDTRRRAGCDDN
jgi:hypothetical protein